MKGNIRDMILNMRQTHAACIKLHVNCANIVVTLKKYKNLKEHWLKNNTVQQALLADSQQALLDGVPLSFGERAAFGQPVDCLQRGVHQLGVVLRAGKEGGTAGQQRQQGRADVPVHGQRRLSGAQRLLWDRGQYM